MQVIKKLGPSIAIISIVLIFIISTLSLKNYPERDSYNRPYQLTESKMDLLNDSLRKAQQDLDNIKYSYRKYVDNVDELEINTFNTLGYAKTGSNHRKDGIKDQMFFVIKSVKLDLNQYVSKSYLQYYTVGTQGYLSWLKITKGQEYDSIVHVNEKTPYRYLSEHEVFMIPVTSSVGRFVAQWLGITIMVFMVLLYLFSLRTFIIFLIEISKNRTFRPKNVARLKTIAIILFGLSIFQYLINIIAYLIFTEYYGKNHMIFNYSFFERDSYWLMVSIVIYLIYIAFKRGMELQEERDLTI